MVNGQTGLKRHGSIHRMRSHSHATSVITPDNRDRDRDTPFFLAEDIWRVFRGGGGGAGEWVRRRQARIAWMS